MTTLNIPIAAAGDDGFSHGGGGFDAANVLTAIGRAGSQSFKSFYRFVNVTVPAGATIDVAYLTYVEGGASNPGNILSNIYLNDVDNATAPTDQAVHAAKVRTSAFTAFDDLTGISTTGTTYNTPAFTSAVQEVVDRAGWVSGNAMMVLWDDDGTSVDNSYTEPAALEHTTYAEPILHIEYTAAVPVTGTVAVTQQDQTSTAVGAHPHVGTLATVQQNQTSSASGSVANSVTGTVAVTQDNQVSTAQGNNAITGTSTAAQANQTSTASGNVSISVTGTVAVTQQNQTSTASGSMATGVIGSGTPSQQNQSGAGSAGSVAGGGSGAATGGTAEQGHRFEAWTLPNVGPFARKFDLTRHLVGYTFSHKWSAISDGRLDLPTDFTKLAELMTVDKADHSNDVGSVIRVLIGTTPINHYILKGLDDRWSSEQQTLTGLLEGMDYYLDRARVPNFDAPASPSVEPDWMYGAPSILSNWDFENSGVSSAAFQLSINATGGTFTLTIGSDTTGAINWNVAGPDLQVAVEALAGINDVAISGAGTPENPFIIEVLSPANFDIGTLSTNSGSLTGLASVQTITVGGASLPDPWTRSQNPVNGLYHGTYNWFQVSTDQAHSGTSSLYIDGDLGNWPGSFPGGQQVVSVTGGRTYRFSVWVYPKFTARYRFVVRTSDETFIGQIEADLTANSWQEMVIPGPVTIPAHVRSVIYRVANISNSHGVQQFYLDDATLAPGMDAATFGKVALDVLAPIQAESVLTWVTPSFTATLDSAGVPWDRTHEWGIWRGQTLLQFTEYADRYNYENGGIRWDVATDGFVWDLFNPVGGGADKENSGFAVIGKMISESGTLSKRIPDATFFHTEGETGHWGQYEDAALAGSWGTLQKYYSNAQGLDTDGLIELATRLVTDSANRSHGLVIRLQSAPVTPWVHFKPGDRNVMVNLAPKRGREQLRCMAIVATKTRDDATPVYEAHWESVVYQGEAAVLEQVRRLVRAIKAHRPAAFDGRPAPIIPTGGGAPTIVIAAADSMQQSKDRADYLCTGVDDQGTIQSALNSITEGRVILCEGNYNIATVGGQSALTVNAGISLLGLGIEMTYILVDSYSGSGTAVMVESQGNGYIRDLAFWNNTNPDITAIKLATNYGNLDVTRVRFDCDGRMIDTAGGNNNCVVAECILSNGDINLAEPLINLNSCRRWVIRDNEGFSGRNFVRAENDCTDINIHDNYVEHVGEQAVIFQPGAGSSGGQAIKIHHNSFLGCGEVGAFSGIKLDTVGLATTSALSAHIDNNLVEFTSFYGIELTSCFHVRLLGNHVEEPARHGIFLNASSDCMLHDNYVWQASQETDNTYDGIFLQGDSNDNSIQANKFIKHTGATPRTRYCVNVSAAACDRTVVVSNQMRGGYQTAAINDAGTGTIIAYPGGGAGIGDNFV